MYIPDLSALQLPPFDGLGKLIAVGWLEPGHEYRQGAVEPEFVQKLVDLLLDPWQPAVAAGQHSCGFCRLTGGPASFRFGNLAVSSEVRIGVSNLWVPAAGFIYVLPSLAIHYVDAHGYSPPAEFTEAVLACPPMRSMQYLKAILKHGPKGIVTTK
jgi:hypothetical protein